MTKRKEAIVELARLSRLALRPDEIERLGEQTERITEYFSAVRVLDLEGVEPTTHVVEIDCYRRPDEPGPMLMALAEKLPYLRYGYFQVPRVLPDDSQGLAGEVSELAGKNGVVAPRPPELDE